MNTNGYHTATPPTGINILVVDNDLKNRELLRGTISDGLAYPRLHVSTAGNAADALTVFTNVRMNVLVTDFNMPGKNGAELIEEIRTRHYIRIPAIVVTGDESATTSQAVLRHTPHLLYKPYLVRTLLHRVRKCLKRVLVVDDDGHNRDLVRKVILEQCGVQVDTANDASGALAKMRLAKYDLVVTDLNMPPGISGQAMARIALDEHLSKRFVFMTSTRLTDIPANQMAEMRSMSNHIIQKPDAANYRVYVEPVNFIIDQLLV